MSCATHIKRINPIDGTAVVYDTLTGAVVTDVAILDNLECCPDRRPDKEEVCIQPNGNIDPSLVEKGWLVSVQEIAADGTLTIVGTPQIYSADLSTNVTTTHEVTECPVDTPIDVPLCYVAP